MMKSTAFALLAAGSLLSGTAAFAAQDNATTTTTTTHMSKKAPKMTKAKTVHTKKVKTAK